MNPGSSMPAGPAGAGPVENAAHELARLCGGGHFVSLSARKPTGRSDA